MNKLSDEKVLALRAYWVSKGRREVTLIEVYESPSRGTGCTFAAVARDALGRLAQMGMARKLADFSVMHRSKPRRECWAFL